MHNDRLYLYCGRQKRIDGAPWLYATEMTQTGYTQPEECDKITQAVGKMPHCNTTMYIFVKVTRISFNRASWPSFWHLALHYPSLTRKWNRLRNRWGHIMKNKLRSGDGLCPRLSDLVHRPPRDLQHSMSDGAASTRSKKENAELRGKSPEAYQRPSRLLARRVVAGPRRPVTDPSKFQGNPVLHAAVATSPGPNRRPARLLRHSVKRVPLTADR